MQVLPATPSAPAPAPPLAAAGMSNQAASYVPGPDPSHNSPGPSLHPGPANLASSYGPRPSHGSLGPSPNTGPGYLAPSYGIGPNAGPGSLAPSYGPGPAPSHGSFGHSFNPMPGCLAPTYDPVPAASQGTPCSTQWEVRQRQHDGPNSAADSGKGRTNFTKPPDQGFPLESILSACQPALSFSQDGHFNLDRSVVSRDFRQVMQTCAGNLPILATECLCH